MTMTGEIKFLKRPDAAIPFGIVMAHGDHKCTVRWDDGSVTLRSLVPLAFDEEVSCSHCGVTL